MTISSDYELRRGDEEEEEERDRHDDDGPNDDDGDGGYSGEGEDSGYDRGSGPVPPDNPYDPDAIPPDDWDGPSDPSDDPQAPGNTPGRSPGPTRSGSRDARGRQRAMRRVFMCPPGYELIRTTIPVDGSQWDCLISAALASNEYVLGVWTTINGDFDRVVADLEARNTLWAGYFDAYIMAHCPELALPTEVGGRSVAESVRDANYGTVVVETPDGPVTTEQLGAAPVAASGDPETGGNVHALVCQ